jgi:5'-3' exonuclease, C-terminal SAM fold
MRCKQAVINRAQPGAEQRGRASQPTLRDAAGVQAKFGVLPSSIPDYLALVGDAADGYSGLAGFGAKSAAAVLRRFAHIEAIPVDGAEWRADVLNTGRLARVLNEQRDLGDFQRRRRHGVVDIALRADDTARPALRYCRSIPMWLTRPLGLLRNATMSFTYGSVVFDDRPQKMNTTFASVITAPP